MRPDGKRVKNADPMYTIVPYIMVKRYDAMNMITVDIPVEPMQAYRVKARERGHAISFLALVIAAYSRTVAEFPLLNRFIVNKRIYDRNEYNVSMVVLKPGEENGTMSKMVFDPGSDVFTVQKIIDEYVSNNRQAGDNNSTDRLITLLLSMPGLISLVVGVLKWMDKHGWMPERSSTPAPSTPPWWSPTWRPFAPTTSTTTSMTLAPARCSSPWATCARCPGASRERSCTSAACPLAS